MVTIARKLESTRVQLMPAIIAGTVGTAVFLLIYYGTLGMLPATFDALTDYRPLAVWNERLDLAQFFGCLVAPPYATALTWWIGAAVLAGFLVSSGVVYAILCSWALKRSAPVAGILFGFGLFFVLASLVSLGSGFNPAVMRGDLPDVGFLYLGWTPWAALQLLVSLSAYGWTMAATYGHWTHN